MSSNNSSSIFIAIFAIFTLINLTQGQQDISETRRLGFFKKCEKVLDITDRCCGDDLSFERLQMSCSRMHKLVLWLDSKQMGLQM